MMDHKEKLITVIEYWLSLVRVYLAREAQVCTLDFQVFC